jgi:voltage-gated chloride channel
MMSVVFLLRFGLGAISYSALTPGGLFAPMLVLGARLGFLYGDVCSYWFPTVVPNPTSLAICGMAAFFAAVVRAPMTGIILTIEMTSSFTMLLPMLSACFAAMTVPTLLRNVPIYDSLRQRLTQNRHARFPRRGWSSWVHSVNLIWATRTGLTHWQRFTTAGVIPSPSSIKEGNFRGLAFTSLWVPWEQTSNCESTLHLGKQNVRRYPHIWCHGAE